MRRARGRRPAGLSDRTDQLEEVATAAVEAGAVSVSTVLLHLRPGVKEVYLERLARTYETSSMSGLTVADPVGTPAVKSTADRVPVVVA